VAGAALDVFEQEPPGENPLMSLPQVITTPHLGASTEEAQISVALEITDQVIAVLDGGLPRFALNAPVALPEAMAFLRPFIPVAEGIGRFYAQVGRQPTSRLEVHYTGEIATYDCSVLTAALLTAFLTRFSAERVNPVNARTVAAAQGITLVEQRDARASEFANLISLQATGDHAETRVGGTLLLNEPHIVTFNDFRIDLVPYGTFLMSWHADRPGIIGAIGTLLGQKNINIASMQVGRDRPRGDAVMILSVDDPVPESIQADIRRIPGMADVLTVTLLFELATVRPFQGILYDPHRVDLARVVAPPYDVITPGDLQRYYQQDPHDVVRLIAGEVRPSDSPEDNKYTRAAGFFHAWLRQGIL